MSGSRVGIRRDHGLARAGYIGTLGGGGPAGVYHQEMVEVRFPRAETVEACAERMNRSGRHLCQCGCGAALVVLPRHRSMGAAPVPPRPPLEPAPPRLRRAAPEGLTGWWA